MHEGILVQPKNIVALSEAMRKLSNDEDLRNIFSSNLTKKANGMYWKDVANKTLQLYGDLLRKTSVVHDSTCPQFEQNRYSGCFN